MSELNHDILAENIRSLLARENMTQQQLATVAHMTQANVSKALNPQDKRCFTLEQVYYIAQHFGISIDELVGNTIPNEVATSPRSVLSFLTQLLCEAKVRATTVTMEEHIYDQYYNEHGYPDCRRIKKSIEYPAFYLPDYFRVSDFAFCEPEYHDVDMEFCAGGNDTRFMRVNEILKDLIPMIKLYRSKQIPEEAFKMILNGYLDQLPQK